MTHFSSELQNLAKCLVLVTVICRSYAYLTPEYCNLTKQTCRHNSYRLQYWDCADILLRQLLRQQPSTVCWLARWRNTRLTNTELDELDSHLSLPYYPRDTLRLKELTFFQLPRRNNIAESKATGKRGLYHLIKSQDPNSHPLVPRNLNMSTGTQSSRLRVRSTRNLKSYRLFLLEMIQKVTRFAMQGFEIRASEAEVGVRSRNHVPGPRRLS